MVKKYFFIFLIETESNGNNIRGYYEGEVLRLNKVATFIGQ